MDIPFGKPPQFPNRLPQKRYSVRENTPKPEPFAAKEIVRSGNHPNSRTNCPQRDSPFGKPLQFPNRSPQKRYSVRENISYPERSIVFGVGWALWGHHLSGLGFIGAPPFRGGPCGAPPFRAGPLGGYHSNCSLTGKRPNIPPVWMNRMFEP